MPDTTDLEADRQARTAAYEAGIARWHAEHDGPEHLSPTAIAACMFCDAEGYRGAVVCDHVDYAAASKRGRAACLKALAKDADQ